MVVSDRILSSLLSRARGGRPRARPAAILQSFVLLFVGTAAGKPPDEPPVIGRPANFSGAIGSFTIAAHAAPTELQAEDPVTFTVTIAAVGKAAQRPPRRPDLAKAPAFAESFYIEGEPDNAPTDDGQKWRFHYRLKPKNADVKAVPSLAFVFYTPGVLPPSRGYQTIYTDAIPLHVRMRDQVSPAAVEGGRKPMPAPDSVLALAEGPDVLLRPQPPWQPAPFLLIVLAFVPPLFCGGWYLIWRRLHPNRATAVRRRHSQAGKRALKALRARNGSQNGAVAVAAVVTEYLRDRYGIPAAEPTPNEMARSLASGGVCEHVAAKVTTFFRSCDTARFAPLVTAPAEDWSAAATRLILTLEK